MRKILSVVLALAIMMTVVSSMAFAATATNTYTGIVPIAGDNTVTCTDSDGDGDYEVVLKSANNYPGFKFDLNGSSETKKYAPADGGYLLVSYTVDFKTAVTGNFFVRPSNNGNMSPHPSGALAAGVYKFSYIYDIANSKIYPYINGAPSAQGTYNAGTSFDTHRIMPTMASKTIGETLIEVSGIKTEEYAAGAGVLAELQAAVVANDTPQAPEHPGGMEHKDLTATGYTGYNTTASGNTVTFSANDGRFDFLFGEDIKFDQSAAAEKVNYIRLHAEISSNDTTKGLYIRPHKGGSAIQNTAILFNIKNPNTVYKFDLTVDLANKTCDYYVNGVHIALRTGTASGDIINAVRFWMYNNDRAPVFTVSNAYLEKYYAKNPVYASYAELKDACNTQEVDLDYAVATYDSAAGKYVLETQLLTFAANGNGHYSVVAGYDSLGNLVFAQKYAPWYVVNTDIPCASQVATMKTYIWEPETLRPLMSVQNVTVNN